MESKNDAKESKDKIPKERRKRTKETEGKFDDDGFFTTPNGSFWDMDGEYFNRYGYDIHGGKYIDKLDYIPGPTWIEELGCYPEDKDKYLKDEDLNDDMDMDMEQFEGDGDLINDMNMLNIKDDTKEENKNNNKKDNDKKNKDKKNKNKNKKKKEEEDFDEDEWEEIED